MRFALICLTLSPVFAQWPKFDVQTRLVTVPVTVTDSQGRPVEGLEASNFELTDDGRPRTFSLDTFDSGIAPIALIAAVQTSGLSLAALEKLRKIGSMIQPVVTGERGCAGVIAFSGKVEWRQQCTNDEILISQAFAQLQPGDPRQGRMLDAALEGIRFLRTRERARRVLLLVSETRDRGSETDLQTVVKEAEVSGVTVYAITYSAFGMAFTSQSTPITRLPTGMRRSTPGRHEPGAPPYRDREPVPTPAEQRVDLGAALEELGRLSKEDSSKLLATVTGGEVFNFGRQKGLEETIQKLGLDLHTQYVLSFVPEQIEPGFHRLGVKIKPPENYEIRSRPGYWAGTQ